MNYHYLFLIHQILCKKSQSPIKVEAIGVFAAPPKTATNPIQLGFDKVWLHPVELARVLLN